MENAKFADYQMKLFTYGAFCMIKLYSVSKLDDTNYYCI